MRHAYAPIQTISAYCRRFKIYGGHLKSSTYDQYMFHSQGPPAYSQTGGSPPLHAWVRRVWPMRKRCTSISSLQRNNTRTTWLHLGEVVSLPFVVADSRLNFEQLIAACCIPRTCSVIFLIRNLFLAGLRSVCARLPLDGMRAGVVVTNIITESDE